VREAEIGYGSVRRNRTKLIARVSYPMKMKGPDGGAWEPSREEESEGIL
jgi:hypothetical protein